MYTFAGKTDENGIWIEDTLFDEETGDYLYSVLKEADGSLSLQTSRSNGAAARCIQKHP